MINGSYHQKQQEEEIERIGAIIAIIAVIIIAAIIGMSVLYQHNLLAFKAICFILVTILVKKIFNAIFYLWG
jgi:membrane protein YdbS with pleckstrin-like domain